MTHQIRHRNWNKVKHRPWLFSYFVYPRHVCYSVSPNVTEHFFRSLQIYFVCWGFFSSGEERFSWCARLIFHYHVHILLYWHFGMFVVPIERKAIPWGYYRVQCLYLMSSFCIAYLVNVCVWWLIEMRMKYDVWK